MVVKHVRGFITRERWLLGKTPGDLERLLGYGVGRMAKGTRIYALLQLPANEDFKFAGHTHWSGGRPADGSTPPLENWPRRHVEIDLRSMPSPEDRAKNFVRQSWTLEGTERLVKVEPNIPHQEGVSTYPIGAGVEQWILNTPIAASLVKDLAPQEVYLAPKK